MAPLPEEQAATLERGGGGARECLAGDEIVISGISGHFPESDSVRDLMNNLYDKVDMVTDDGRRWHLDNPDIPSSTGKVNGVDLFDAQFFGVHYKQAWCMDPMSRMMLENTYGAIIDAGVNPRNLRNTNTAVYVGVATSDAEKMWYYEKTQISGFGLTGTARSMLSNRISYWLGAQGPSYTVNTTDSSTLHMVEHAYNMVRTGVCEAAVVGGANLCAHPFVSLLLSRIGVLSEDGRTRSFDKNASGYGRSEAINMIYIQKAKNAKRAYAQIVHAKSNCKGFDSRLSYSYANKDIQKSFLEEFYSEIDVLPAQVKYIEAFGVGLPKIDKDELDAIDEVFCKGRNGPLLVGCVKSNLGHTEAASGAVAVTKICLAYNKGEIAPNLHYNTPRDDIEGLREGRIKIVTEPTPFTGGYTAASSFSFTGVNVHLLFKDLGHKKIVNVPEDLPRLVAVSGRSEEGIVKTFQELESTPLNVEQVRLMHNIHEDTIPGHVFRGFDILKMKDGGTVSVSKHVDYFPGLKRPVWFVYSGMGSQWSGMGTQLMRIPIFATAIQRCCRALAPKGVDLMKILTDPDPQMFDNILHSFVGIAAVQIGLTDVLFALGIEPDHIIGHSVGELGCAYADRCFTLEEMILSAYSRGLVSIQTPLIRGSMAAVGLGFEEIKGMCPPSIEVACHNATDSCTISGPAEDMKGFVAELTSRGIFAKEVNCSHIAYHSRYIADAGPGLLKYLREVIKEPKARSSKWLSTSVPQNEWDKPSAKFSSAEYHTNNLLNSVLFEETSKHIPPNAITIEVAPHGLLQAILRRSLGSDCINIPLTKRGHSDNVEYFLNAIGNLYIAGVNSKIANIYPEVRFPVSAQTPMLSHLVGWEHSEIWLNHLYYPKLRIKTGERRFLMSICDEEHKFMSGCVINGVNVFPASGYLVLAWETLGMILGVHYTQLSVVFENVRFESEAVIEPHRVLKLIVMVQKSTGNFEIISQYGVMASGRVYKVDSTHHLQNQLEDPDEEEKPENLHLTSDDVYAIMASKGYSYLDEFRSIESAHITCNKGKVFFKQNWVTFLDGILQMNVLGRPGHGISKPKLMQKLSIDVKAQEISSNSADSCFDLTIYDLYNRTRCGGVELEGLVMTEVPRINLGIPVLESYNFVPYFGSRICHDSDCLRIQLERIYNDTIADKLRIVVITEPLIPTELACTMNGMEEILRQMRAKYEMSIVQDLEKWNSDEKIHLAVVYEALANKKTIGFHGNFEENAFILAREKVAPAKDDTFDGWVLVSRNECARGYYSLMKKRPDAKGGRGTKYITVKSSSNFPWLQLVKAEWRLCDKLVLVSENDSCGGLLGLFNCLRREAGGRVLSLLLIDDHGAPAFRPDLPLYRNQLGKNLALNVYKHGEWGSYQYSPLEPVSVQSEHVYLSSQRPEDISSLVWTQGPLALNHRGVNSDKKLVRVYYSAVSHMDALRASGRLRSETSPADQTARYGMDFSGRTSTGERVMGLVAGGALSSLVEADVDMMWPVPAHWSLEDAATVPLAYANAYYCLELQAGLQPGMSVLIHSGSGALGQAAINICLSMNCEVFTTVSSAQKKRWLLKMFPALKEKNISNSRNSDFEDVVMSATKEGCDVILNNLSGELLTVSMRCLRPMGVFINLSKDDFSVNTPFGMSFLKLSRTFMPASVCNLFHPSDGARRNRIQQLIATGIASGAVRPLSRLVLSSGQVRSAFRLIASGRHVGKVVLSLTQEELRPLVTPPQTLLPARPRYNCIGEGVYIVILDHKNERPGLDLADWIVERGASNLVLHSYNQKTAPYRAFKIRNWRRRGIKINVSHESLDSESGCLQFLTGAIKLGPVLGLFVAPRLSQYMLFEQAQPEIFASDFCERTLLVMHLDMASKKLCPQLREFVVLSNAAAGKGKPGSSSGALADSVLERICEERTRLGLPAQTVQVGDLREVTSCLDEVFASKQIVTCVSVAPRERSKKLYDTIAAFIGLNRSEIDEQKPLSWYSVDISSSREIQAILERDFQIFMTPNKILLTTFTELKELESRLEESADELSEGLGVFFRYVDEEEFNVGDPLVRMPTLLSDADEAEEETYQRDRCLILIPGMEGHKEIFSGIAKRLKLDAFTCQLEFDRFDDSIEEMAKRMSSAVLKTLKKDSEFLLLGYSFGVTVALEVASNLETLGYKGKVFCLDGSPSWFNALLEAQISSLSEDQLQDEVIVHMFKVMSASGGAGSGSQHVEALRLALAAESDWERKLDACMRRLRGRVQFSFQYQRSLVAMAYARIQQARAYSDARLVSRPLRSEIILLKATRRTGALRAVADRLGHDLGLGAYTKSAVRIHELDCDHASAAENLNVSDILNSYVADLESFKTLNLCDVYISGSHV